MVQIAFNKNGWLKELAIEIFLWPWANFTRENTSLKRFFFFTRLYDFYRQCTLLLSPWNSGWLSKPQVDIYVQLNEHEWVNLKLIFPGFSEPLPSPPYVLSVIYFITWIMSVAFLVGLALVISIWNLNTQRNTTREGQRSDDSFLFISISEEDTTNSSLVTMRRIRILSGMRSDHVHESLLLGMNLSWYVSCTTSYYNH